MPQCDFCKLLLSFNLLPKSKIATKFQSAYKSYVKSDQHNFSAWADIFSKYVLFHVIMQDELCECILMYYICH